MECGIIVSNFRPHLRPEFPLYKKQGKVLSFVSLLVNSLLMFSTPPTSLSGVAKCE